MQVISKETLINEVASQEGIQVSAFRQYYETLENIIVDHLSSTTPTNDVKIKLFDGLSVECKYVPQTKMEHPDTRKEIIVPEKIWAKPKITRYFNRKINMTFHNLR